MAQVTDKTIPICSEFIDWCINEKCDMDDCYLCYLLWRAEKKDAAD